MSLATIQETKPKTFSRSRAIDVIRNEYIIMKSTEETMTEYLEQVKTVSEADSYKTVLQELMVRHHTTKNIILHLCKGFGIDMLEIDSRAV